MLNFSKFLTAILVCSFTLISCSDDDGDYVPSEKNPQALSLNAVGIATAQPVQDFSIAGTGFQVTGNAFTMDFFDNSTGEKLGTLTDINVAAETFPDGSMKGENFTIFTFAKDKGTLVMHNLIDMRPVDEGTLSASIKLNDARTNLVGGTGIFEGSKGGSTLNAILDMTAFANGTVGFDCVYNITLK
ncbi:hypothetical protein [Flagellimonas nanhaiensis]|uniref:Uncharacterized protein n=1 Tax=Flagellimonas nanhaiensis TaxID=2292706 RepID=A0A371JN69_9FLAO|nr:hypothetical protein [Allomuricauda nanhaiensis]RDY58648.1 hypothetical protein DX873_13245 [Allomuricauda nanhaiensis]